MQIQSGFPADDGGDAFTVPQGGRGSLRENTSNLQICTEKRVET